MQVSRMFVAAAVAAGFGAVATPVVAQPAGGSGPSFNCAGVKRWVERTICGDPELAAKDAQMAGAYRSFMDQYTEGGGPGTDTSGLRAEQRAWLARRNQCRTRACLHRAYDERIKALDTEY